MPMSDPDLILMEEAARAGGAVLTGYFGARDQLQVQAKGPADFVSRADLEAEAAIQAVLKRGRPDAGYLGEESGYQAGSSTFEWVVDPLDGTTNFLCGIPHFAVSIALREGGETIRGLVYQPVSGELFCARKGGGATLDGAQLHGSPRRSWDSAVVAAGIPHHGRPHHEDFARQLAAVRERVGGVRRFGVGSLDLAWTACGRFDAFWEQGIRPWDVAAGNLLVREAGGIVTGLVPGEDPDSGTGLIAAQAWLHEELAAALRGHAHAD